MARSGRPCHFDDRATRARVISRSPSGAGAVADRPSHAACVSSSETDSGKCNRLDSSDLPQTSCCTLDTTRAAARASEAVEPAVLGPTAADDQGGPGAPREGQTLFAHREY